MTQVIRKIGQFALNYCPLQKMYNVSNELLLETTKDKGVSLWFGEDTAETLKAVGRKEFVNRCRQMAGDICYACNGSGKYDAEGSPDCESCEGTGVEE